jgi:hypothetical protein
MINSNLKELNTDVNLNTNESEINLFFNLLGVNEKGCHVVQCVVLAEDFSFRFCIDLEEVVTNFRWGDLKCSKVVKQFIQTLQMYK